MSVAGAESPSGKSSLSRVNSSCSVPVNSTENPTVEVASEQTRANRRTAGRKAALAAKARRTREQLRAEAEWGPAGSRRGAASLPAIDMSIPAILERLRTRP